MVDRGRLDYLHVIGAAHPLIEPDKSGSCVDPLPENFQPGKWDVLCCGGKEGSEHVGNKRYRICIANNVEAYRNAKSKYHKSMLVSNIVTSVKDNAENGIGGFVKKDPVTGRWYQVDDKIAREKVSHALRDAIKVQKRKEARHRRMNDRHHDTKVTANEQGRLQRDTLGAQLALDNMIMRSARPSSIASMFSDKSPQTYYPTKTVQLQNGSGDCLFNGILATFDSWGDDWEQSLKECTERFLKSDDELSFSTMG